MAAEAVGGGRRPNRRGYLGGESAAGKVGAALAAVVRQGSKDKEGSLMA